MKPAPNAATPANIRRIRNTDQGPNAVGEATFLVETLQQEGWTRPEIDYRYVVSSWTGYNYDAVDLTGTRLREVLTELAKN